MKKKQIVMVIITLVVIVLSYLTGYETCTEHYKQYYDATEIMLDSIDANNMLDVVMESDEYQDYIKAKEDL